MGAPLDTSLGTSLGAPYKAFCWPCVGVLTSLNNERIRRNAATNSPPLFARITPRLADNASGLSTHGNGTSCASSRGLSSAGTRRYHGTSIPAADQRSRANHLFLHASTAA